MSTLQDKVRASEALIERTLKVYRRPFVMSSFGKDSMVMLYLLKDMGIKLPVLFHREPFFPLKYRFANRVIEKLELSVYDYPPSEITLIKRNGIMEIINWYATGSKFSYLPTGIRAPQEGEPFLCGYWDIYRKPTIEGFNFPWDLGLVGHKSTDKDPIFGAVPLTVDLKKNEGGPDYLFPLRDWSDEDVWAYHKKVGIPVNTGRYDPENNFKERADISFNNDYHYACVRCMDKDEPAVVHCPILDMQITNISGELKYTEYERPAYLPEGVK